MKNRYLIIVSALILLVIGITLSILLGHKHYSLSTLYDVLYNLDLSKTDHQIIYNLRIPRTIIALLIGSCLGISGVLIQAITNNEMASPCIFGINSGAGLGIILCLLWIPHVSINTIMVASLIGSTFVALCIMVAGHHCSHDPMRITLIGVVITSLISAMTVIGIISNGGNPQEVLTWITGTLVDKTQIPTIALAILFIMALFCIINSHQINIMILGTDTSKSLGQDILKWKITFSLCVIIFAGLSVALAGAIGFIGLIIPHITIFFIGTNYRLIIPISMLFGSIFLLFSDLFTRSLNFQMNLPIGLTMAIIGAPFLLYLTKKREPYDYYSK